MNYIKLFANKGGDGFARKKFDDFIIHSVCTRKWADYDFSDKPFGICVKNTKENISLYSLTLDKYRFEDINGVRTFIKTLSKQDFEIMLKELTAVNNQINNELKVKIKKEAVPFDEMLRENNIDFVAFHKLNEMYKQLPRHMRQYYKIKNNLPTV